MSVPQVVSAVAKLGHHLVEVTGGEPLLQKDSFELLQALCDAGHEVMLETCGAFDITQVDRRVRIIMDLKCPGSKMDDKMRFENLEARHTHALEIKFVVGSRNDFEWAEMVCQRYSLQSDAIEILMSPVSGLVSLDDLASWILGSNTRFRLQLQLHKVIWPNCEGER